MTRLTDKLWMHARARYSLLIERRKAEGKRSVRPTDLRCVMWCLINHSGNEGHSRPALETIARESETSTRTVQRCMQLLTEEGIVTRIERSHAGRDTGEGEGYLIYHIDWSLLHELRDGGRLTDPDQSSSSNTTDCPDDNTPDCHVAETREPDGVEPPGKSNATDCPVASASGGSGASNWPNRGEQLAKSDEQLAKFEGRKEETLKTQGEPPPLTPPQTTGTSATDDDGPRPVGGGALAQQGGERESDDIAGEIVDAYYRSAEPPATTQQPIGDRRAAIEAIRRETDRETDGVTPDEILAAAKQAGAHNRRHGVRKPRWTEKWLSARCYWPLIQEQRKQREADRKRDEAIERDRARRASEAEQYEREIAEVDRVLDGLSDGELDLLKSEALDAQQWVPLFLTNADPRTSVTLRRLMAAHAQQPHEPQEVTA